MKRKIRLNPAAEDDLNATLTYLGDYDPSIAFIWLDEFQEFFRLLSEYPHLGAASDHIRLGMRRAIKNDYRILYHVDDHEIVIVRILHPRREIDGEMFS